MSKALKPLSQDQKDKIVIASFYKDLHICVWTKQIGNKRYCPEGHEEEIDWSQPHKWMIAAYGKDYKPVLLDDVEAAGRRMYPALRELGKELKKTTIDSSRRKIFTRKQFEELRRQTSEEDQGLPDQLLYPTARTLKGRVTFKRRKLDVLDPKLIENNTKLKQLQSGK